MTNEEAIGYNKNLREYMRITDKYNPEYKFLKENYEALDMAIKALKQELMLDKIRAKIEKLQKMCDTNDLNLLSQYSAFGMALDVIDKYKAESEEV
jgi:hypothetical protein